MISTASAILHCESWKTKFKLLIKVCPLSRGEEGQSIQFLASFISRSGITIQLKMIGFFFSQDLFSIEPSLNSHVTCRGGSGPRLDRA